VLYRKEFLRDDVEGAWPALTTFRIRGLPGGDVGWADQKSGGDEEEG
jgi:hypothetical protein